MIIRLISISGGKDSTALYLWALDNFQINEIYPVFADTGNEHPVTYNYLKNLPLMAKGPEIKWVKASFADRLKRKEKEISGNPFLDLMIWKGRAPSTKAQFCTEHLKLAPIRDYLESIRGDDDVISYTGIRAGESLRRSKMPVSEFNNYFDCVTERPLLKWSEAQVFDYLKTKGIPPNPLYALGFQRVGCFPCIHARKSELAKLPDWAWDKLTEWENKVGRSWFKAGTVPGVFIPSIQDVREWCATTRGGKQFDLFNEDSKDVPSCMSTWGICE